MTVMLITGASRGIGRRLAELALEDGIEVIATARDVDDLAGLDARHLPLDVTEPDSIRALAASLEGQGIDILVNNAGIYGKRGMRAGGIDYELWNDILVTNLFGPMRVLEALLPNLRAGSRKTVANISSRMGSLALTSGGELGYRSSKAALNSAMRATSIDLADEGFTIALISPGWVRTDMGGASAELSIDESAVPLLSTILGLTTAQNGAFIGHDGSPISW
jgi:NAD(P)-dependent dehydrogenase (short-subunit alcohol dehydrogenase family)